MSKSRVGVAVSDECLRAALSQADNEIRLAITVRPGAKKTSIEDGPQRDRLLVRVQSPPIDGRANDAVIAALAIACAIKKRQLRIVHGHTGREKVVAIADFDEAALVQALAAN